MVTVALTYLVLHAYVLNVFHAFVPFKLQEPYEVVTRLLSLFK